MKRSAAQSTRYVALALLPILALALLFGCGPKAPVVDDPPTESYVPWTPPEAPWDPFTTTEGDTETETETETEEPTLPVIVTTRATTTTRKPTTTTRKPTTKPPATTTKPPTTTTKPPTSYTTIPTPTGTQPPTTTTKPPTTTTTTAPTTTTTTAPVKVTGVAFSGVSSVPLVSGRTHPLTWAVTPSNATNKGVVFNSSNTAVATVTPLGVVTAKGEGTAVITITTTDTLADQNFTDSITVTVTPVYATSINISGPGSVQVGKTIALTATVLPSNVTTPGVTWSSADPLVATVSAAGVVTGLQPTGEAGVVIRATAKDGSGVYREVSIIVTAS